MYIKASKVYNTYSAYHIIKVSMKVGQMRFVFYITIALIVLSVVNSVSATLGIPSIYPANPVHDAVMIIDCPESIAGFEGLIVGVDRSGYTVITSFEDDCVTCGDSLSVTFMQ